MALTDEILLKFIFIWLDYRPAIGRAIVEKAGVQMLRRLIFLFAAVSIVAFAGPEDEANGPTPPPNNLVVTVLFNYWGSPAYRSGTLLQRNGDWILSVENDGGADFQVTVEPNLMCLFLGVQRSRTPLVIAQPDQALPVRGMMFRIDNDGGEVELRLGMIVGNNKTAPVANEVVYYRPTAKPAEVGHVSLGRCDGSLSSLASIQPAS